MAPKGKKRRSSHSVRERRSRTQAGRTTKIADGIMCINVSVACDEKVASTAAICAGLLLGEGRISARNLRRATARATTIQNQKPARSHTRWRDVLDAECSCNSLGLPYYRTAEPRHQFHSRKFAARLAAHLRHTMLWRSMRAES